MAQKCYGIEKLYLHPVFKSRDHYREVMLEEAPRFNATFPIKLWLEPTGLWYPCYTAISQHGFGQPAVGSDGRPSVRKWVFPDDMAAGRVNIPDVIRPGDVELPPPLRPLSPGEELYLRFGGTVGVRQTVPDPESTFTAEDRALLHAIAARFGIKA